ncbi:MAG: hypothetical protein ACM3UZ_10955 [Acidobacteriota bacterium]
MKGYVKPTLEYVQLKSEERFAGSIKCDQGYCEINGKPYYYNQNG